jgi:hypothetical protein
VLAALTGRADVVATADVTLAAAGAAAVVPVDFTGAVAAALVVGAGGAGGSFDDMMTGLAVCVALGDR